MSSSEDDLRVASRVRVLLVAIRQALIIMLGAIEDFLGMQRSITPRRGIRK